MNFESKLCLVILGMFIAIACGDTATTNSTTDVPDPKNTPPDTSECTIGENYCADPNTVAVCTVGDPILEPCPENYPCVNGECVSGACVPGEALPECVNATHYAVCAEDGVSKTAAPCDPGQNCFKGQCGAFECEPETTMCLGFGGVQKCLPDGSGWKQNEICEKGGVCKDGECIRACDVNIKAATYVGCTYFAADLDNIEGGQYESVGLVVSVPTSSDDTTVTVTNTQTGAQYSAAELGAETLTIPSGTLRVFLLPGDMDIDGSQQSSRTYHVETSFPATVHQFNPLNGDNVYTNDASLILPTTVLGSRYLVMSWPLRKDGTQTLRGFAAVIAVEEGETEVLVVPRSTVIAGLGSSGVEGINANTATTFTLSQGQILNLETGGEHGDDLTGTLIQASKKVAVFGGHECANVPLGTNACDHLEQQLTPTAAWGHSYIADVFHARTASQFDVWRIMSGAPDVVVTTNPPQPGYEEFKLQEGSFVTFTSQAAFTIQATGPIQVGHYMIGSSYPGHVKTCDNTGIGDPAMTLTVPVQQYLSTYTVLTPPGYTKNYINIVAPLETEVTVDNKLLNLPFEPVGDGEWGVIQLPVQEGVHEVEASSKVGLTAYGYDCDVSYAYPGGMRLKVLDDDGGTP
jgi:hypothetical protein